MISSPAARLRELIAETRPFEEVSSARSWAHVAVATLAWVGAALAAVASPWWPLSLALAVLAGLCEVRLFIMFHDHVHGALLRSSPFARAFFFAFGCFVLVPRSIWRYTHDYHHAHNTRIPGSHIGGFWLMTTEEWALASAKKRLIYKISRSPITIALAYVSVFAWGMCMANLIASPRKNVDSAVALIFHAAIFAAVTLGFGWQATLWGVVVPMAVSSAMGAWLFYIQHTFEGGEVLLGEEWSLVDAAFKSTSYLRMGAVMAWFTGNIGYHHIHHVNPRVPFYRLPEAMAALPSLQHPLTVPLSVQTLVQGFRLKLWDAQRGCMVGYP